MVLMTTKLPERDTAPLIPNLKGIHRIESIERHGSYWEFLMVRQGTHTTFYRIHDGLAMFRPWDMVDILFNDQWITKINHVQHEAIPLDLALPYCPELNHSVIHRLECLLDSVKHPLYHKIMSIIFAEKDALFDFLTIGASKNHHHSEPGGLLRHSVETAELITHALTPFHLDPLIKEGAVVAALLHDYGKVVAFHRKNGMSVFTHRDHAAAGVSKILPIIDRLEQKGLSKSDQSASEILRFLLMADAGMINNPSLPVIELLRCADRTSAALDRYQQSFAETPSWKQLARSDRPDAIHWRPRYDSPS